MSLLLNTKCRNEYTFEGYPLLRKIASKLASILNFFEKPLIEYYCKQSTQYQPIFIIGVPRSGSTILFQVITNTFDVLYPTNLVDIFQKNFFLGFIISETLLSNRAHNCFTSFNGRTYHCGLNAPNECEDLFSNWILDFKNYIPPNKIPKTTIQEIKQIIYSVINKYKRSIIFKNLRFSLQLELISVIAPNSKFIFIKRNPLYTSQSIMLAKRREGFSENKVWYLRPSNFKGLEILNPFEQTVKQVFFLEKQIHMDLSLFPNENHLIIKYEDMFNNFESLLKEVHKFVGQNIKIRGKIKNPFLKNNNNQKLNDEDFNILKREVNRLDWDEYS